MAKDARRVDVLCYRIYLSYRLLDGTSRFRELHEIVKEAKAKLETEVGPVNGVSSKMARGIVSRLSIAGDVQKLCSLAIGKADEWLANISSINPNCRGWNLFQILSFKRFVFIYGVVNVITYVPCYFCRGFTSFCLQVSF